MNQQELLIFFLIRSKINILKYHIAVKLLILKLYFSQNESSTCNESKDCIQRKVRIDSGTSCCRHEDGHGRKHDRLSPERVTQSTPDEGPDKKTQHHLITKGFQFE
jgi:hypothetical protein